MIVAQRSSSIPLMIAALQGQVSPHSAPASPRCPLGRAPSVGYVDGQHPRYTHYVMSATPYAPTTRQQTTPPRRRTTGTHYFLEEDRLGLGGSCDVYCGVEKDSGKRHALKVLRRDRLASKDELLGEARTLRQLSCSKIVKLIALEVEESSGLPVVVMEYCNGGSLLTHLQQPENARGIDDREFLLLFSDMVEAISYLRSKGFVHRDIKPGNILRHVVPSGKVEYKLSDFGTSRTAAENEETHSIVGTEEYLHPVLYKHAFFGGGQSPDPSGINSLSGDYWSLGCTLYHAITASVPFKPIGGARANRKAMLVMICQKPAGAISGQQTMDGDFRWSKQLPGDCCLSESLREVVTPLLQNLTETDASRQWTFATFLDESQVILSMRRFHVCDTECGREFLMYLRPKQSLAEMQDRLAYHTEVPAEEQILFHRVQPLSILLSSRASVKDLPETEICQPLLLLTRRGSEGRCIKDTQGLPQALPRGATLEADVTAAFRVCRDIHHLVRAASSAERLPSILFSAVLALRTALTSVVSTVETRFRVLSATCQERQIRLGVLTQIVDTTSGLTAGAQTRAEKLREAQQLCTQLRESLWKIKYKLDEVRKTVEPPGFENTCSFLLRDGDGTARALENIFALAKSTWQKIRERKEKIPLTEDEQGKHAGDREVMNRLCAEGIKHLQKTLATKSKLLQEFSSLKRMLCERLDSAQAVDSELLRVKDESENFSKLLSELWSCVSGDLKVLSEMSRVSLASSSSGSESVRDSFNKLLSDDLPDLETFQL